MKFWKKLSVSLAVAALGISAVAPSVSAASVNSELKNKGELTIGLEGTYAPFSYRKDGKLTGFEVELGKAVAKKMGLKAKFVPTKWDSLIAGLGSGKFDVVMNDITPTPQRAKQYNYSEPYIQSHYVLIMKDNANFTSIKDVKGKKVAAGTGTDNEKIAKKFGAKTVPAADFASGLDLVRQGRVQAEVNSKEAWSIYAKKHDTKGLKMIDISDDQKPAPISAMFNKKTPAIESAYNKALKEVQADGTVKKLSEKYFGTDITE
ncbi:transporter substrate-binding domain-containing protein [Limosilactobacillus equigenerosi]|uniref:High affinity cystine binding protein n=1 Tax=Limosilactobacillus equigenerosi DSM 18793 = JCM 14505 TaxID=1423742 RepID=A0A0R1USZ0_9LACO|nr:transporter substrate-binding domain-containing protein [Limosilactobacillus equigenerosi]KRL96273.1 high affinity cystine binding protein [Limosilactobacillus equigenerosi DSM 18793 = JCM 14505]